MTGISRRRFLQAGVITGAGAALSVAGLSSASADPSAPPQPGGSPPPAVQVEAGALDGPHQAALLGTATRHTTFVSFDVTAADVSELRDLLRAVTQRQRLLYAGGLPVNLGPAAPADDNGILGESIPARQVAFVLGLGASLFDADSVSPAGGRLISARWVLFPTTTSIRPNCTAT